MGTKYSTVTIDCYHVAESAALELMISIAATLGRALLAGSSTHNAISSSTQWRYAKVSPRSGDYSSLERFDFECILVVVLSQGTGSHRLSFIDAPSLFAGLRPGTCL